MVIDVNQIKKQGCSPYAFSFDYAADNSLLGYLPDAVFARPVRVYGEATLDGNDVIVKLKLSFIINCPCSRCLEQAVYHGEYEENCLFYLSNSRRGEDNGNSGEPCEDELFEYPYKCGVINLKPVADEALVTCCPNIVYCKEDCKGLCPVCGANRNFTDCGHK